MSQVLFRCPRINDEVVLLFKDSKARPLSPAGATPGAVYLPLHLVGRRRGLASRNRRRLKFVIEFRPCMHCGYTLAPLAKLLRI
jgi:hypothetical protein